MKLPKYTTKCDRCGAVLKAKPRGETGHWGAFLWNDHLRDGVLYAVDFTISCMPCEWRASRCRTTKLDSWMLLEWMAGPPRGGILGGLHGTVPVLTWLLRDHRWSDADRNRILELAIVLATWRTPE